MQISEQLLGMANENKNVLQEIFRDRVFNGIHQGTTWQLHRYGVNCKLSGSVYAVSEIEGAVPLIHGPAGCAFHQRLTPRKMYAPDSEIADTFRALTTAICENEDRVMPDPLSDDALDGINEKIEVLLKENETED